MEKAKKLKKKLDGLKQKKIDFSFRALQIIKFISSMVFSLVFIAVLKHFSYCFRPNRFFFKKSNIIKNTSINPYMLRGGGRELGAPALKIIFVYAVLRKGLGSIVLKI